MKKEERVKSSELFNYIINKGNKISNTYFTLFYLDNNDHKKLFGISAPKKLGNAVVRNRIKRQLRSLIFQTKKLFKNDRNYIIIVKKSFIGEKFDLLKEDLIKLIGDANEK